VILLKNDEVIDFLTSHYFAAPGIYCNSECSYSSLVPRLYNVSGMWSRSKRLGLETVLRRTNVSSRSRLG